MELHLPQIDIGHEGSEPAGAHLNPKKMTTTRQGVDAKSLPQINAHVHVQIHLTSHTQTPTNTFVGFCLISPVGVGQGLFSPE